ncbi:aminotransferase class IV [Halopenitus sp. H-Gu1]|uniref:aminotransferase class IV n=1 Tax=Halopenitus sp. H-Gu1 TaxID=3242697 RepID=UPI00359CF4B0
MTDDGEWSVSGDRDRSINDEGDRLFHVDGELVPAGEATVNVRDRGFMYGDAAFETLRAYGGAVFEWEAHADRLANTCDSLALDHGLSRGELRSRIDRTLAANDFENAYLKISISRGVQPGTLDPDPDVDPTVVVYARPLPRGGMQGNPVFDGPATIRTAETRSIPDAAIPATAKTHNYLDGILARIEARAVDADEALLCDADGHVAEGATSNVFFVSEDVLRTPSLDGPVLPGITRRIVLDLAAAEGIPVEEGSYEPEDLRRADEAFLTNTIAEIRPIETIDETAVGGGPITRLLRELFDRRVERICYR